MSSNPRITELNMRRRAYYDPAIVRLYVFRLCIKDILRCRSVCRTWNNIISCRNDDTAVVEHDVVIPGTGNRGGYQHLETKIYYYLSSSYHLKPIKIQPCILRPSLPPQRPSTTTLMILLLVVGAVTKTCKDFKVARIVEYEELIKYGNLAPLKPPKEEFSYGHTGNFSIVGVCNDWVCLLGRRKQLVIWNQTMSLYQKIDPPPGKQLFVNVMMYGFGYHYGQYKILLGFVARHPEMGIYELDSKKWTILQGDHWGMSYYCSDHGCFLGDSLHWLGSSDDTVIIRFSFSTQEFYVWPVCNKKEVGTGEHFGVMGTFQNCLCYYTRIPGLARFTMWKMNKYGVTNSWVKVWTIQLADPYAQVHLSYIYFLPDRRHILMVTTYCMLLLYDRKKGCIAFGLDHIGEAAIYTGH